MEKEIIEFIADKLKIYPPTEGESVTVSFKTGTYSLPELAKAIIWQANTGRGERRRYITVRLRGSGYVRAVILIKESDEAPV